MKIRKSEELGTERGKEGWFTGQAWTEDVAPPGGPDGVEILRVHFTPGTRTAWHSHPDGQLLHVTAGEGWVQSRGGVAEVIRAGDTVRAEPGERHWHGATTVRAMTHLAIQRPGTAWYEHLDDTEYQQAGADARRS